MKTINIFLKAFAFTLFFFVNQSVQAQLCQGIGNCPPGDDCGLETYYKDGDGDGKGNPNISLQCISNPFGYVRNADDCDDSDPTVWNTCCTEKQWYKDGDGDGFGDPSISKSSCTKPIGYVSNNQDCDDDKDTIHGPKTWYVDNDNDGLGANMDSERNQNLPPHELGQITKISCTKPEGYVDNNGDCNDVDSSEEGSLAVDYYEDADGDGYGNPDVVFSSCQSPSGYVSNNDDCNDEPDVGADLNPDTIWYKDVDKDEYSDGVTVIGCERPNDYYLAFELLATEGDCDDEDPTVQGITWYADQDKDSFGDPNKVKRQCTKPDGYVANRDDRCPYHNGKGNGCPEIGINYIKTRTPRVENVDKHDVTGRTFDEVTLSTMYFDGLGNNLQQVIRAGSPLTSDVVVPFGYDVLGRMGKDYLPYVATTSNGSYQESALMDDYTNSDQYQFYQTTPDIVHDQVPYAKKTFEKSPLSRVSEQRAPGTDWVSKPVKLYYNINKENEIVLWHNNDFNNLKGSFYDAGELTKNSSRDEDGNWSTTFTNKMGQTILKRSYLEDNVPVDTYYIYDRYGNLKVVLPPEAVKSVNESIEDLDMDGYTFLTEDYTITPDDADKKFFFLSWVKVTIPPEIHLTPDFKLKAIDASISDESLDLWAFQYEYDGRNRMIRKKVPGAGWMSMVYDQWDRLVLTQDSNQKLNGEWLFTKYDELNRVILTGIKELPDTEEDIRTAASTSTDRYETFDGSSLKGYTDDSYPSGIIIDDLLSVNYYDDYGFVGASSLAGSTYIRPNALSAVGDFHLLPEDNENVKGQATGSLVENGKGEFLTSMVYYDDHYRPIQTISENHLGGKDIVSNQYDFNGAIRRTHVHHEADETIEILREFDYDHTGRLLTLYHQINDEEKVLLVGNIYNELGQLLEKNLHQENTSASTTEEFEQSLDYTYNIQGWLTAVNDSELSDEEEPNKDLFGMELYYNTSSNLDNQQSLYNGNISAMRWSDASEIGSDNSRAYTYDYDKLDRLKAADHFENNSITNQFDVSGLAYDLNGNIETLKRRSTGTSNFMDNLDYTYNGNRLMSVADVSTDIEGFKDGNTSGDDYSYDGNGNMIIDANKSITSIEYNHLNLPIKVVLNDDEGTKRIEYQYNAAGTKLQKAVYTGGNLIKVTDYIGEFIYETEADADRTLQLIQHEEGRIIPFNETTGQTTSAFDYQYHLTDHLGNTRLTFSTTPENYTMTETFESGEENGFQNLHHFINSRANTTPGGNEVCLLQNPDEVGGMLFLGMNKGDTINLSVNANYEPTQSDFDFVGTTASTLFGLFEDGYSMGLEGLGVASNLNGFLTPLLGPLTAGKNQQSSAPHAYLNYIFFDADMNYVSAGFKQISSNAEGIGVHETLTLEDIIADRKGYILAYLSNENQAPVAVHFDDFEVYHGKTNIVQSDDYYPFGLSFNSYKRSHSTPQNFKFQGQEHIDDLGLNWDQFKWRNHDPALGRFFNVDPLAEDYYHNSPYAFAENKVITFIELEGLEGVHYQDKDGITIEKNVVVMTESTSSDYSDKKNARIEKRNAGRVEGVTQELNSYFNESGVTNENGNSINFKFNVTAQQEFDKSGMSKKEIQGEYIKIAKENGIEATKTAFGTSIDLVAPAAVITRDGSGGSQGSATNNVVRLNSGSPEGATSHEALHTLGVPDNGYTSGGLLNSPPQQVISSEARKALKLSYKKRKNEK